MASVHQSKLTDQDVRRVLAGKTVCIVDDEEDPIEILEAYLDGYGMTIDSFTQPDAAIDHIAERAPDILLLDVMMPEMDGWEIYAKLRAVEKLATLPVLFVTCVTDQQVEPEMEEGRLCATLSKPVEKKQLISKMIDLLG